jgi:alanine racemase
MPVNKYYYFIEDLDVTADGIPDGVLVRQVSIKDNFINYHKNMYISVKKLKEMIKLETSEIKHKPILVSNKIINDIKNKNVDLATIPRIVISKKSYFAQLLHKKNINQTTLLKDLNNLFK